MNTRTQATVVGYVGTTLSFMNNQAAWQAAQVLSTLTLDKVNDHLQTLPSDIQNELQPLVTVLMDPSPLRANNDECDDNAIRVFLFELIGGVAKDLLENQPIHAERDIAEISREIQATQAQMRISSVPGNNRSHNIDTALDAAMQNIAWFQTRAGQDYLFNLPSEESDGLFILAGNQLAQRIIQRFTQCINRPALMRASIDAAQTFASLSQAAHPYVAVAGATISFFSALGGYSLWQQPRNEENNLPQLNVDMTERESNTAPPPSPWSRYF